MDTSTLAVHLQASSTTSALSAGDARMLAAYRKMDDEARGDHLAFAESSALAHPRRAANPLRLVGGTTFAKPQAIAEKSLTVAEFCAVRKIELPMRKMQLMGKATAKYSREMGLMIGRAVDQSFGEVNTYCAQALEAIAAVMCPAETAVA
ncbi:MAG: hypothetical protein WA191_06775 [Telluria sp.]